MSEETPIDSRTVRELAAAAHLTLTPERAAQLAPQLRAWLTAANELNTKMSARAHWTIAPVTIFTHTTVDGASE